MDNTLIFIAGDHGEEFGEYGFFGHDSMYDPDQIRTIIVVHIPGQPPQKIQRVASHLDFVPTILSYMGVENPLNVYAQGCRCFRRKVVRMFFSQAGTSSRSPTGRRPLHSVSKPTNLRRQSSTHNTNLCPTNAAPLPCARMNC
jgi:membrane-anchored protein YejM (alkaline phosphatase superfamily)